LFLHAKRKAFNIVKHSTCKQFLVLTTVTEDIINTK